MSTPDLASRAYRCGTYAGYVQGCRCDECRRANRETKREADARRREIALTLDVEPRPDGLCPGVDGSGCPRETRLRPGRSGRVCGRCVATLAYAGMVDATPAREHLEELAAIGVGSRAVHEAADVALSVVRGIRSGRRPRCRRRTLDAILSVDDGAAADGALVDARPIWRMLRQLQPEYLTWTRLAHELGYQGEAVQLGRRRMTARNAWRVRQLHRRVFGDC